MVLLRQNDYELTGLTQAIQKLGTVEIDLNKQIIEEDLIKLSKLRQSPKNETDLNNIDNISKYLKRLRSRISMNGKYHITWLYEDWQIKCYPLSLIDFKEYNIKASDYINITQNKLVKIDYSEAYQIIAFDMMFRDLGYTDASIEKDLEDIGLTVISPSSRIQSYIDEDALRLSKVFKIGNSPYANFDGSLSWDYFYTAMDDGKPFYSKKYRDCVERSVNVAISIIVKSLLDNFNSFNIDFRPCTFTEEGFYIFVDSSMSKEKLKSLLDNVIVRSFGRKFEVKPKIELF